MTFFYELNKRLKDVLEAPKSVHQTLNERDMSRAAKGHEKYGKNGMEALAKAGREGKDLDPIRAKYNKYDKSVEEGLGSIVQKIGGGMKKAATKAMDVVAPSDEKLLKKLQKDLDMPQTGKPPMASSKKVKEEYGPLEEKAAKPDYLDLDKDGNRKESMKKAAADKKKGMAEGAEFGAYYYEKLAQKVFDDNSDLEGEKAILKAGHDIAKEELGNRANGVFRDEDFPSDFVSAYRYLQKQGVAEGWDDMLKDVDRRRSEVKLGHKVAGAKGDIEKTATGVRHTRRYDPKTGETDSGDETGADGQPAKRGRGRPKGSTGKIGAKGPSGTSKLMTRKGEDTDVEAAMKLLKKSGYKVSKGTEELDEKAVSVSQRRAAGIAHAAQKGEIPKSELRGASKEMAKMSKGELNKFAATKEKGLPAKKSKKEQSVEETTVAGSVAPGGDAPAGKGKGGITFGKGIYDSMNREIENLIAESMNVSMNISNDAHGGPTKSLTVTATDDDAEMLGKLLKMAGLGSSAGGSGCGCGNSPCSCKSAERVEENQPEWPTDEVVTGDNDDHMTRWAGGLNKPKTTVAGDGQTTVPVTAVQMREDAGLASKEALAKQIFNLEYNIHQNDKYYGQDTSQEEAKLKQLYAQFAQQFPGEDAFKLGSAIDKREYQEKQNQRDIQRRQDQEVATRTSNVMQKAKRGLGGMYEQDQVMSPGSDKPEADLGEELQRMREMAGLKSAMEADSDIMKSIKSTAGAAIGAGLGGLAGGPLGAAGGAALGQLAHKGVEADIKANQDSAVKEDDMEEGNRFLYNLKKAREAGKEKADLDGDGDLEKVRESINSMWKAYKG